MKYYEEKIIYYAKLKFLPDVRDNPVSVNEIINKYKKPLYWQYNLHNDSFPKYTLISTNINKVYRKTSTVFYSVHSETTKTERMDSPIYYSSSERGVYYDSDSKSLGLPFTDYAKGFNSFYFKITGIMEAPPNTVDKLEKETKKSTSYLLRIILNIMKKVYKK